MKYQICTEDKPEANILSQRGHGSNVLSCHKYKRRLLEISLIKRELNNHRIMPRNSTNQGEYLQNISYTETLNHILNSFVKKNASKHSFF